MFKGTKSTSYTNPGYFKPNFQNSTFNEKKEKLIADGQNETDYRIVLRFE
jgi:hypothetical protein